MTKAPMASSPEAAAERSAGHELRWVLIGYAMWAVGCLAFAVAAAQNRDWFSLGGSVLFLLGIVAIVVPMLRDAAERTSAAAE